jgi:hypothetical protein
MTAPRGGDRPSAWGDSLVPILWRCAVWFRLAVEGPLLLAALERAERQS